MGTLTFSSVLFFSFSINAAVTFSTSDLSSLTSGAFSTFFETSRLFSSDSMLSLSSPKLFEVTTSFISLLSELLSKNSCFLFFFTLKFILLNLFFKTSKNSEICSNMNEKSILNSIANIKNKVKNKIATAAENPNNFIKIKSKNPDKTPAFFMPSL